MSKRRCNSEGSIYQRKDGRWVASVTETTVDGRRRRVCQYADSQNAARKLLTKLKGKQDIGLPVHFNKISLRQWLDRWLEEYVKPTRSPRTFESYHAILSRHLPESLGKMPLFAVRPEHVQRVINSLSKAGKGRTAALLRATLRSAMTRARKSRLIEWNPVSETDPPKYQPKEGTALTAEEAATLLRVSAETGDRLTPLWTCLVALGLRRGEALALHSEDVDLVERVLHVRRTLTWLRMPGEKEGHWIEKEPKTKGSARDIELPMVAVRAFARQMETREREKAAAGVKWHQSQYLFTNEQGYPLHGSNVVAALHEACKRAEVREVRVHDLRHSCGSFLAAQGESEKVIMQVLGHTQRSTVQRYIHTYRESLQRAMNNMGDRLEDAMKLPAPKPVAVSVAVNRPS